ncbi:DUF1173 family protein [Vibrio mimicus]
MLNIVDAIEEGNVIRPLTSKEEFCLHPERRRTKTAQQLFQRLKENNEYLYCQCVFPPAVMFTRHSHKHGYSLVCHPTKGKHSKQCVHYRDIKGWVVHNPKAVNEAITRQADTFPTFSLHSSFAQGTRSINTKPQKGSTHNRAAKSGKRVDKLVNLVRFLIKTANQNTYVSGQPQLFGLKALEDLRDAAQQTTFGPSTLKDWIFIGAHAFTEARTALTRVDTEGTWPSKGRPHAFMVMVADHIVIDEMDKANKTLTCNGAQFFVKRILTEGQGIRTPGPYLVFMSICQFVENGKFRLHTAYVKPILYSNWLMPVDSDHERKFARQVIHCIQPSHGWALIKPLEGKAIEGCFVMPDFLLENDDKNCYQLIEIMGMLNDQDYVDRKDYIVPLMAQGWPSHQLFELNPVKPSKDIYHYLMALKKRG